MNQSFKFSYFSILPSGVFLNKNPVKQYLMMSWAKQKEARNAWCTYHGDGEIHYSRQNTQFELSLTLVLCRSHNETVLHVLFVGRNILYTAPMHTTCRNPELNVPVYLIIAATDNSCLATSQQGKAKEMESATSLLSTVMWVSNNRL